MEKEKKDARIFLKIEESIKAAAQEAANQEGRSMSNYIVKLIAKDCKDKKIIN